MKAKKLTYASVDFHTKSLDIFLRRWSLREHTHPCIKHSNKRIISFVDNGILPRARFANQ